jgi:hypothetical protein
VEDDQLAALRRLGGPPPRFGGRKTRRKESLRNAHGDDTYPVETILVFHRSGRETRAAVKVADGMWRVTGCKWLRRWDGLLRTVGPGYDLSLIE